MRDTEGDVEDRSLMRYIVNLRYVGDDEIGRMVHDLMCEDPKEMYSEELRSPMEYYKNTEEGRMNWQSDIARYVKQGIEEGSQKTRREDVEILLRKKRLTADEIATGSACYSGAVCWYWLRPVSVRNR